MVARVALVYQRAIDGNMTVSGTQRAGDRKDRLPISYPSCCICLVIFFEQMNAESYIMNSKNA